MSVRRVALTRRLALKSVAVAASALYIGPAVAPADFALAGLVTGALGFTATIRIDPRSYLKAGQQWTTVACIRPAMQAALNEAHRLTLTDPDVVALTTTSWERREGRHFRGSDQHPEPLTGLIRAR